MSIGAGFSSVDAAYQQFLGLQSEGNLKLMEDIRKSIEPVKAGFQNPTTGGAPGNAGAFWPLIPEDLDPLVSLVDFKAQHLKFFDWLPKGVAKQTVVQYARLVSHGLEHMDNATVEGAIAIQNVGKYGRGNGTQAAVQIKQYSETRSITDVAATAQLFGQPLVPTDPLVFHTNEAMLALHRCIERDSFFGNSAVAPSKFDGVITQLKAAGQVQNFDGAQLTMETLEDMVRDLQSPPFYGMPTDVMVTPKVFTSLSRQQIAMARRNMDGNGITYGFKDGGLQLTVGDSELTVKPYNFLDERKAIPADAAANDGTVVVPVMQTAATPVVAAADAASKFASGDAGFYAYAVMAFGPTGYTARIRPTAVAVIGQGGAVTGLAVAAGDKVTVTVDTDATYTYFKIFRTKAFASLAALNAEITAKGDKAYQYLESVAKGGNATLVYVDLNLERTDCGKTLILRKDPAEIEMYQLIKLMRLPLARVNASQPFFLLTALALAMKVPEHAMLLTNCAPPS